MFPFLLAKGAKLTCSLELNLLPPTPTLPVYIQPKLLRGGTCVSSSPLRLSQVAGCKLFNERPGFTASFLRGMKGSGWVGDGETDHGGTELEQVQAMGTPKFAF